MLVYELQMRRAPRATFSHKALNVISLDFCAYCLHNWLFIVPLIITQEGHGGFCVVVVVGKGGGVSE